MARRGDGRLICEGIAAIQPGAYGSTDGAREAARNRKLARQAVAKADGANACLEDAAFRAALADLPSPDPAPGAAPARVVAPRFGSPVRGVAVATADPVTATAELQRYVDLSRTRLDRGIFARRGAPDGEASGCEQHPHADSNASDAHTPSGDRKVRTSEACEAP